MRDAARQIDNDRSIDRSTTRRRSLWIARTRKWIIYLDQRVWKPKHSRVSVEVLLERKCPAKNKPREELQVVGKKRPEWISRSNNAYKCISDTNNTMKIVYTLRHLFDTLCLPYTIMCQKVQRHPLKNLLPVCVRLKILIFCLGSYPYQTKKESNY